MTEQAPYKPEFENRTWKSKLKDSTVRAAKVVSQEAGRAVKVAGVAIAREGAKELLNRANDSQKQPAPLNPERRDAKSTLVNVIAWAGPVAVRAVLSDIQNRVMQPPTEQFNGSMNAGTPFESAQPHPEPGFPRGFEATHTAGQTGSSPTGSGTKV